MDLERKGSIDTSKIFASLVYNSAQGIEKLGDVEINVCMFDQRVYGIDET